jgi:uncharacterized membrane protein YkvA (DUF1232 family)
MGVGYFAVANDMIPDNIPGLGLVDDALRTQAALALLADAFDSALPLDPQLNDRLPRKRSTMSYDHPRRLNQS